MCRIALFLCSVATALAFGCDSGSPADVASSHAGGSDGAGDSTGDGGGGGTGDGGAERQPFTVHVQFPDASIFRTNEADCTDDETDGPFGLYRPNDGELGVVRFGCSDWHGERLFTVSLSWNAKNGDATTSYVGEAGEWATLDEVRSRIVVLAQVGNAANPSGMFNFQSLTDLEEPSGLIIDEWDADECTLKGWLDVMMSNPRGSAHLIGEFNFAYDCEG